MKKDIFLDNTQTKVYHYGATRNPYSPYNFVSTRRKIREVTDEEHYMCWLYSKQQRKHPGLIQRSEQ